MLAVRAQCDDCEDLQWRLDHRRLAIPTPHIARGQPPRRPGCCPYLDARDFVVAAQLLTILVRLRHFRKKTPRSALAVRLLSASGRCRLVHARPSEFVKFLTAPGLNAVAGRVPLAQYVCLSKKNGGNDEIDALLSALRGKAIQDPSTSQTIDGFVLWCIIIFSDNAS